MLLIMFTNSLLFAQWGRTNEEYDDIYYNQDDRIYEENQKNTRVSDVPETEYRSNTGTSNVEYYDTQSDTFSNERGSTVVNNNYYGDYNDFNYDDYYDYAYTSRIRRFNRPVAALGYYDPYYTDLFWYSNDPFFYGSSIYVTYNWWRPRPWNWNVGWGWNSWNYYNSWAWNYNYGWGGYYTNTCVGWGNNWGWNGGWGWNNGWGWGNNAYQAGYWNGYNDAMWATGWNTPFYYNSYDANSYVYNYGHRGDDRSSSSGVPRRSLGEKYQSVYGKNAVNSQFVTKDQVAVANSVQNPRPVRNVPTKGTAIKGNSTPTSQPSKGNSSAIPPRNNTNTTPVYTTPGKSNTGSPRGTSIPESSYGTEPVKSSPTLPSRNQTAPSPVTVPKNNGVTPRNNYPKGNTVPGSKPRNTTPKSTTPRNNSYTAPNNNFGTPKGNSYSAPKNYTPSSSPKPRNTNSYTKPKTYTSPKQEAKPKTRNYSAPKTNSYSKPKTNYTPKKNNSYSQPKSNSFSAPKGKSSGGSFSSPSKGRSSGNSRPRGR